MICKKKQAMEMKLKTYQNGAKNNLSWDTVNVRVKYSPMQRRPVFAVRSTNRTSVVKTFLKVGLGAGS